MSALRTAVTVAFCLLAIDVPRVNPRDDAADALATVNKLLAGWRTADTAAVNASLHANFRLVTLRNAGTNTEEVQIDTRERLLASSARLKPGMWDVHLMAPEVKVSAEGIATVWATYSFYIGGRRSHCGVELYQLYKMRAGWQIANFADTHHECPA